MSIDEYAVDNSADHRWYYQQRDERKRKVLAGEIAGDLIRDRHERSKRLTADIMRGANYPEAVASRLRNSE
jgi:hypothetical protein